MYKVYLVTFTVEGKKVYKVGITGKSDVQQRFQKLIDSGDITDFKVHLSRWFKTHDEAFIKEQSCFYDIVVSFPENNYIDKIGSVHFHNVWLDKQISGVTEIRKYDYKEYKHAYNLIDKSGYRYITECK